MTDDIIARGVALTKSGKYTPTAEAGNASRVVRHDLTDHIPLPPEPDEPYDPGPSDEPSLRAREDFPTALLDEAPTTPVYADRVLTRSALRTLPAPEPLIDNVLDQGTTALLYGRWGTAKSFIALDWGLCVATGHKWQGRTTSNNAESSTSPGKARSDSKAASTPGSRLAHRHRRRRLHRPALPRNLTRPSTSTTWRPSSTGAATASSSSTPWPAAWSARRELGQGLRCRRGQHGAAAGPHPRRARIVLGVHHAGKDGKTLRGSSAFEGAADTVYFSSRDGAVITLAREKRKDGPENDHHQFVIDPIDGTEQRRDSSTWRWKKPIVPASFCPLLSTTSGKREQAKPRYALSPTSPGTFYRALSDLVKNGVLVNTGTDKTPFYKKAS